MPRLVVSLPDGPEATHELTDDVVTVGRVSDNAIQIEDASVSSHHAELTSREGTYILKDLGSTNGTRLNGQVVEAEVEMRLSPGDRLLFGSVPIAYLTQEMGEQQPMPTESEPALAPASTSIAPADFTNASPFQKKKKEKDSTSVALLAVGILALLAAGAAAFLVTGMERPPL